MSAAPNNFDLRAVARPHTCRSDSHAAHSAGMETEIGDSRRDGKFVCRCCGEPGEPAFRDAHACVKCWDAWVLRTADCPGDGGGSRGAASPTRQEAAV